MLIPPVCHEKPHQLTFQPYSIDSLRTAGSAASIELLCSVRIAKCSQLLSFVYI